MFLDFTFDINFGSVLAFAAGIFTGALLLLLLYTIMVLASMGSKKFIIHSDDEGMDLKEVKDAVLECQKSFKERDLRGQDGKFKYCGKLCYKLAYDIAKSYFPNSKNPLYEISIDEGILLLNYISDFVEQLLGRKGLKLLKKLKISQIVSISVKSNAIAKSNIVKTTMKFSKVRKIFGYVLSAPLQVAKAPFEKLKNVMIDKMCLVIIAVVGEQCYKIYSKKAFEEENEISQLYNETLDSIDSDVEETEKEIAQSIDDTLAINEIFAAPDAQIKFKSYSCYTSERNYQYTLCADLNFGFKKKTSKINLLEYMGDEVNEKEEK